MARIPFLGAVAAFALGMILCGLAQAHPLSQGALTVALRPDGVAISAKVTVEEVTITNRLTTPDSTPDPFAAMSSATYEQHAAYLAAHLHVIADGVALPGGVAAVRPPDAAEPGQMDTAVYELLYPFPAHAPPPARLELRSDVLSEARVSPGQVWDASYLVRFDRVGRPTEMFLLTAAKPVTLLPPEQSTSGNPDGSSGASNRLSLFAQYFLHGIHHIFSRENPGYDHLLFVSALVLGAGTLWELFKLVTAFTLAHTITLTLAALNLVHVSERVVEPLIALSICFVAIENVVWPDRSHGWLRLGVAFFFGLFHGLGFAGGLLATMQGMSGSVVLVAIVAFSLGVEAAHQLVVIPLFFLLKLIRETRSDPARRRLMAVQTQRFGSAAICFAGLFYLFVALRLSFGT